MKDLLELRRKLKKKKPRFLRQDAHRVKKLEKKWRAPKGRHSKMRFKLRSYRKQPSIGYSSPRKVRGLDSKGRVELIIENVKQLEKVKNEVVVIGATVGTKKKIEILKKIKEKNLQVKNVRNIEEFIKQAEEKLKEKKEEAKKRKKEKKKSKEEEEKREEERKKEEEMNTEEE
ncbi:MAG: 50S ribosomal protein L32e, partial [Candidatus Nanoarchaeia archaeon]